ncbi:hypothetical protein ACODT4_41365 [Streptomyces sp. 2.9]
MQMLTRATTAGMSMKLAADAAGISRSTFMRWMRKGEEVIEDEQGGRLDLHSPTPEAALFARVQMARAASAIRSHVQIEEAARGPVVSETYRTWTDPITGETRSERRIRRRPGDWRASAWMLARISPENYGPNPKSFDQILDEEVARTRAERDRGLTMKQAVTVSMQDLAVKLKETLAELEAKAALEAAEK